MCVYFQSFYLRFLIGPGCGLRVSCIPENSKLSFLMAAPRLSVLPLALRVLGVGPFSLCLFLTFYFSSFRLFKATFLQSFTSCLFSHV